MIDESHSNMPRTGDYNHSESIVLQLCDPCLRQGKTVYADNFYSSVPLAEKLLDEHTYYCGTLRKNRKLGMYRISSSYPVIRPIFHYPAIRLSGIRFVTQLSGIRPDIILVSGRISYWYPAGYLIIALLAVTCSSSRVDTPMGTHFYQFLSLIDRHSRSNLDLYPLHALL